VCAFRRGCDDYVARPFDYESSSSGSARCCAVGWADGSSASSRPLEIDLTTRVVLVAGRPVGLSQKSTRSSSARERAAPRSRRTSSSRHLATARRLGHGRSTLHVSRIRRKLREVDPETPFVENVWGVGYRLLGLFAEVEAVR
jgi:DNA-binding response OmpR family regulator